MKTEEYIALVKMFRFTIVLIIFFGLLIIGETRNNTKKETIIIYKTDTLYRYEPVRTLENWREQSEYYEKYPGVYELIEK